MEDVNKDVKVQAFLMLGREAYTEQKYEDALSYYNKVLELAPHSSDAYRERGAVYFAMGDKINAEKDMLAFLKEDPKAADKISGMFNASGKD